MPEKFVLGVCKACGKTALGFRDGMNNLICVGCAEDIENEE